MKTLLWMLPSYPLFDLPFRALWSPNGCSVSSREEYDDVEFFFAPLDRLRARATDDAGRYGSGGGREE